MVREEPRVEGTLSDPLWKRAPELSLRPVPGQEGKLKTTVRLLFGDRSLFAAIQCEEPDRTLQARVRDRDGEVWSDDCVELYILPHPEVGYKHISINPLGTVFDQAVRPGRRGDRGWNAAVKVAVSAGHRERVPRAGERPSGRGEGWKVALSVPYEDLGAFAGRDQTWRFNATRLRKARGETPIQEYTWSDLPTAEFHQPDAFGAIEHIDIPEGRGGAARTLQEFHSGLGWTQRRDLRGIRRLFAHPLDPDLAWCATETGLLATHDDGQTWTPVEAASADAVGEVTCLAVSMRDPDTLCIGTDRRGLFLSTDGGKAWKPLGGEAERPASDHIEWVDFCPSDPTRTTLLATHGLAAPGFSLSRDLGATWEVFGTDRFLERFVKQAETVVAVGSMTVTGGKVWGIHRSGTDGLRWEETIRGLRPAAPAATWSRWQFFVSTLGGTILQSFNDGKSWTQVVQSEGSSWNSLFFTNGPDAQTQILAAYDPHRQGLCLSRHRFSNGLGERENRGLYVGPFVKSGAACIANANGSTYYVAMNNALWVGRWARPAEGPAVVRARCVPASVRLDGGVLGEAREALHGHIAAIASDEPAAAHLSRIAASARAMTDYEAGMKFTLQALVEHPRGPGAIRSVAADASKLGAGRAVLLYDDGKHNDERPGDGLYADTIRFAPAVLHQPDFRDTLLLTVTATDTSGAAATWPAVVHISRGPAAVGLMRGGWDSPLADGPVSVQMVGSEGVEPKASALRFAATGPGPWRSAWVVPDDGVNSAGLRWFTFAIRGDVSQELYVHLVDHHKIGSEGFFDEPHWSRPVPLIAGGYLKAITPAYQQVRIPIGQLLPKGVFFLRWHTAGIGLSVPQGARPATYHVDLVQIEP